MCNAKNHSPGCSCGFGPPYTDVMYYGDAREWPEEVVDEPWLLRRGLEDLNYSESAIEQFIEKYADLKDQDAPRLVIIDTIKEMLGRRQVIEEDVWDEHIKVPLYRLSAPKIRGAKVTYSEGEAIGNQSGWRIKMFPIGTGHSRELEVARNHSYTAEKGECKQVYVPVRLRVARVRVEERGKTVSTGIRAEVPPPQKKSELWLHGRGCESLPRAICRQQPDETPEEELEWLFSGDRSGTVHEMHRSWKKDITHQVSIHLKRVVDVSAVARVQRIRKLSLDFKLPSGYDYRGLLCGGRLWWSAP